MRHLPAWYTDVNKWFGIGHATVQKRVSFMTFTNNPKHLTKAGQKFFAKLDKKVLARDTVPYEAHMKALFLPRQVKLTNIRRSNAQWAKLRELAQKDDFAGEIEVAWIKLLGDVLVKDSEGSLWKHAFSRNDTWSPHITLMAFSVRKKALLSNLATPKAAAEFNSELNDCVKNSSGVLLDGQEQCLPLVEALFGKDGMQLMSRSDLEVEKFYSSLEGFETFANVLRVCKNLVATGD